MKKLILLYAIIFLTLPVQAASLHKLTFCRPNNMVSALAYIAEEQGYFRDENLDVTFVTVNNAKICIDELIAGNADVLAGGDGPISYLGFTNHPLKIIAQTSVGSETSLFARSDKGLAQESDMKGKKIGYLPGTVSYLYLARLLEKTGLAFADIQAIALQPPAMPQALQGGVIDGFVMWEPWVNQALKALGDKALRLNDNTLYNYRGTVIIGEAFAKQSQAVHAVLQALLKAEAYIHNNPKNAIAFLAKTVKLDQEFLEKHWGDYEFRIKLDDSLIALMEANARLIIRDDPNFKDKPIPNYRRALNASFLKTVATERVAKDMKE